MKRRRHLVWEEVLDPNYDFTKFKSKNLTGVYGGVSRGESCEKLIFPVNGLKTSEDTLNFKWTKTGTGGNYNFIIYNNAGNGILDKQIKDTQVIFTISQLQFNPGKYYWLVKSNDVICEDDVVFSFEILTKEEENNFINSIIPANNVDLADELETIDKLEKNAFIYAAKSRYTNAIKNYPGNEVLQHMYVIFLLHYGFDDEALKLWNAGKKS